MKAGWAGTGLAVALILSACGAAADAGPIRVFAASSLQDALPDEAAALTAWGSTVTIQATYDASSRLREQIVQGAPADLFLSADSMNVDLLFEEGVDLGVIGDFAANQLVLVVPAASAAVANWADLARPGTRIVAASPLVPIDTYASELVTKLAHSPGAPSGFAAAYRANIVSREDNVRAVLAKVELGEADAAFVYATDADSTARVRTLPLPSGAAVEVRYTGVVLASGERGDAAAAFLAWLGTAQGAAIMEAHGFARVPH